MRKNYRYFLKKTFILMILLCYVTGVLFSLSLFDNMAWYKAGSQHSDANQITWKEYSDYADYLISTGKMLAPSEPYDFNSVFCQEKVILPDFSLNQGTILLIFNKAVYDYLADCDYLFDSSQGLLDKYVRILRRQFGVIICTYNSNYMDSVYFYNGETNNCPPPIFCETKFGNTMKH